MKKCLKGADEFSFTAVYTAYSHREQVEVASNDADALQLDLLVPQNDALHEPNSEQTGEQRGAAVAHKRQRQP